MHTLTIDDINTLQMAVRALILCQKNDLLEMSKEEEHSIYGNETALLQLGSKLDLFESGHATSIDSDLSVINSEQDLRSLATEFINTLTVNEATHIARNEEVDAAIRLAERSSSTHSVLIPDEPHAIESGEGCGVWIPALVYVPNREINWKK